MVHGAIESASPASVWEVYRHLSCRPRCGKCVADVAEMIESLRADGADEALAVSAE